MPDIRVVQTHRIIDPTAELHDVYPALVITDLEMPEMTDLEVSSE